MIFTRGLSILLFSFVNKVDFKHHNLNMASTAQAEDKENRLKVKEIKITKSLAIIAFSFALCWIPFWVIVVIQRFRRST